MLFGNSHHFVNLCQDLVIQQAGLDTEVDKVGLNLPWNFAEKHTHNLSRYLYLSLTVFKEKGIMENYKIGTLLLCC